jgi:uncharacterized membrane protein
VPEHDDPAVFFGRVSAGRKAVVEGFALGIFDFLVHGWMFFLFYHERQWIVGVFFSTKGTKNTKTRILLSKLYLFGFVLFVSFVVNFTAQSV